MSTLEVLRYLSWTLFITLISSQDFRLPTTILPRNYGLVLNPSFTDSTFEGEEYIEIDITDSYFVDPPSDTFQVSFNLFPRMTVSFAQLFVTDDSDNTATYALSAFDDSDIETTQIVSATFDITNTDLQQIYNIDGYTFQLYMEYSGILYNNGGSNPNDNDLAGWYKSDYQSESNNVENLVTQFQATDARRAFPSFDEPAFKATFDISFIAPMAAVTLSNMPISASNATSGDCQWTDSSGAETTQCKVVTFETTPTMSTYLLAFVIGDYDFVIDDSNDLVPQRVYFPHIIPSNRADFALQESVALLEYFSAEFDIPYTDSGILKLDSIGVSDFAAGAMENWGMVIYRSSRLLVDEETSSLSSKRGQLYIIAHELAHQWFGNLVSPAWWDDLWLNEGFATYMGYEGAEAVQPGYDILNDKFTALSNVLITDSSVFTHPVQTEIDGDPSDILAQFDSITYQKGMGVINTIANYMGKDVFMDGITSYLTDFEFDVATSADLGQYLDAAVADENVNGTLISLMMQHYISTDGFPLIWVEMEEQNADTITLTVTQQRMVNNKFYEDSDDIPFLDEETVEEFLDQTWYIPMMMEVWNGDSVSITGTTDDVMTTADRSLEMTFSRYIDPDDVEYYLFNGEFKNYFRVYYDEFSIGLITDNFNEISKDNQFQIISDRYALMMDQYITPQSYLDWIQEITKRLIDNLGNDEVPDYNVWGLIAQSLVSIDDMFCELDEEEQNERDNLQLRLYFRRLSQNVLNQALRRIVDKINEPFEVEEDIDNDALTLQSILLWTLVRIDDDNVKLNAYQKFYQYGDRDPDTGLPFMQDGLLSNISSNLLRAAFGGVLAYDTSNNRILEYVLEIYGASSDEQKAYILQALGLVYPNEDLVEEALDFIFSDSVRPNVIMTGLESMKICLARYGLWNYLTANNGTRYDQLFSMSSIFIQGPLTGLPSEFGSIEKYFEIQNFYTAARTNAGTLRVVNQTLENVWSRYLWVNNNTESMKGYMREYVVAEEDDDMEIWQIILVALFCCIGLGLVVLAFWLPSKPSDSDRLARAYMSSKRLRKRTQESARKLSQQGADLGAGAAGHSLDRSLPQQTKTQQLSDEIALVESTNDNKKKQQTKKAGYGATAAFDYQRLKDDDEQS